VTRPCGCPRTCWHEREVDTIDLLGALERAIKQAQAARRMAAPEPVETHQQSEEKR